MNLRDLEKVGELKKRLDMIARHQDLLAQEPPTLIVTTGDDYSFIAPVTMGILPDVPFHKVLLGYLIDHAAARRAETVKELRELGVEV